VERFVFVTQQVDPAHPTLGVTAAKIRALAARVDEVVVLADHVVEAELPANARVRLFGARSRAGRGLRFATALNAELSPRPLAVLAHMVPLYAILAAPLTRPRRVPLLLWFTHWRVTRRLLLAERLATAVVTVDRRSFPLRSAKVAPIGHGIDMETFRCVERRRDGRLRVLALGRTSPAKGLETIVRAAELADADLELRGPSLTEEEHREADRLRSLGARVEPPLRHAEVPALLAGKDVLVNNMREGALD
jgi:glycosyltransferase involved in cell wall biosynthesis